MSLATQISALVSRLATEFKTVYSKTGDNANLTTTAKGTLVAAINELAARPVGGGAEIDDTAAALDKVYSSTKVTADISAAIAALVDGAPGALDTLKELADALAGEQADTAALLAAVGNRVRFDAAQVLTAPQQVQARSNIGAVAATDVGDVATDFVAAFETALAT